MWVINRKQTQCLLKYFRQSNNFIDSEKNNNFLKIKVETTTQQQTNLKQQKSHLIFWCYRNQKRKLNLNENKSDYKMFQSKLFKTILS